MSGILLPGNSPNRQNFRPQVQQRIQTMNSEKGNPSRAFALLLFLRCFEQHVGQITLVSIGYPGRCNGFLAVAPPNAFLRFIFPKKKVADIPCLSAVTVGLALRGVRRPTHRLLSPRLTVAPSVCYVRSYVHAT